MGARIHRVGGSRSSFCETDDGWPLLVKYARGHERATNTTFFIGIRPDLDRRTIIGIAFGDSEEDLFLPARLILDNREYISTDHRELKPYFLRDGFGDIILRVARKPEDYHLTSYRDPLEAMNDVGFSHRRHTDSA
jgi:hypothetical protein